MHISYLIYLYSGSQLHSRTSGRNPCNSHLSNLSNPKLTNFLSMYIIYFVRGKCFSFGYRLVENQTKVQKVWKQKKKIDLFITSYRFYAF